MQKLTASDGAAGDYFGISVAIGSHAVVVETYRATVDGNSNQDAAYVFERNQDGADN